MGDRPEFSGRKDAERQFELELRFRTLEVHIARQQRTIKDLEAAKQVSEPGSGVRLIAAKAVLGLMEKELAVIIEDLGYNPRVN